LTIGNSRVFELAKLISNSLNIPYLTIKSDTNTDPTVNNDDKYELNMHPPISKIMEAIIDLMDHYKWTSIAILYQEPSRIEDLVRVSGNSKYRLMFKQLTAKPNEWSNVIKEIKEDGFFHIVIDIKTDLINQFLVLVNISIGSFIFT
jgi:hypothetical protein